MTVPLGDAADIEATKLNEYTKEEWRDIAEAARPGITDEEYEAMWERFQRHKQLRSVQ